MIVDPHQILLELKAYRDNMSEFDEEEMDYLIELVQEDIDQQILFKEMNGPTEII